MRGRKRMLAVERFDREKFTRRGRYTTFETS